jgi:hypothetical protein
MMNADPLGKETAGQDTDDVLLALAGLHYQTMRTLSNGGLELSGLQKLAEATVQIRSMLAEWKEAELAGGGDPHVIGLIDGMNSSYLGLEGHLKEARNTLSRQREKNV